MSKERQKGTSFETSLVPLLRRYYPDADRSPAKGSKDVGDFKLPGERRFILEAKNHASLRLAQWLKEAQEEAIHAALEWGDGSYVPVGLVVHKRRGTQRPEEQYVTLTLGDLLWLVHGER